MDKTSSCSTQSLPATWTKWSSNLTWTQLWAKEVVPKSLSETLLMNPKVSLSTTLWKKEGKAQPNRDQEVAFSKGENEAKAVKTRLRSKRDWWLETLAQVNSKISSSWWSRTLTKTSSTRQWNLTTSSKWPTPVRAPKMPSALDSNENLILFRILVI